VEERKRLSGARGLCTAVLALGLTSGTAAALPSPRATEADVSYAVETTYAGEEFARCGDDGHTCSQTERDWREGFLTGVAVPRAVRDATGVPGCASAIRQITGESGLLSKANKIDTGGPYRPGVLRSAGKWTIAKNGRHYHADFDAIEALRACALVNNRDCAALSPQTRTLLSLTADCRDDATAWTPPPTEYDGQLGNTLGLINTRAPLPSWTDEERAHIRACMAAHHTHGDVQGCLRALETRPELTADQQHLVTMLPFVGLADPQWAPGEADALDALTDVAFQGWGVNVLARDWQPADDQNVLHAKLHQGRSLGPYPYTFHVFARELAPSQWPVLDAFEVLP